MELPYSDVDIAVAAPGLDILGLGAELGEVLGLLVDNEGLGSG